MQNFVFIKPTQEKGQWQTEAASYFGKCWLAEERMSPSWEGAHGTFSGTRAHAHKSDSRQQLPREEGDSVARSWDIPGFYRCEHGNEIHQEGGLRRTVYKPKACRRAREKESKGRHPSEGEESKIILREVFQFELTSWQNSKTSFSPLSNIYVLISVSYG